MPSPMGGWCFPTGCAASATSIIIDHGDGYMSLYGNNETLFKQAGETVRAAMQSPATGNSGGNPETGLYFEMRYQSRPFDPLGWVQS